MNKEKKRGVLIAIEGIDGSGKSSAAQALYTALTKKISTHVILTKEPGATQLGKQLRAVLQQRTFDLCSKAEYLLFAADRAQHFDELIIPALNQGVLIISDRMADSSLAYQGYGRGLDKEWIQNINGWAMNGYKADLTIYLSLDYETAMARLRQRNETATVFEKEKADFFQRLIEGFETIYAHRTDVITIDARPKHEMVHAEMIKKVINYLEKNRATHNEQSVTV